MAVASATMSTKHNLMHIVQQRLQYVQLMSSCGAPPGSVKHGQLLADCSAGVLQSVRVAKAISPSCAMELKVALEAVLSPAAVELIMTTVNGKVDLAGAASITGATAEIWEKSKNIEIMKKTKYTTHEKQRFFLTHPFP